MNPNQIRRLFPNASASVLAANANDYGSGDATAPASAPQTPPARVETPKQTHDIPNAHHDHPDHSRQNPKLERDSGNEPLETSEGEEAPAGRIRLRVVSVRKRLCDPDNLSPKWLIDSLRYCGAIRNDTPEDIILEVAQRKAKQGEAERTLITIQYP